MKRPVRYFVCAKCGTSNPDFLTFGVGKRHYCLNHTPWTVRLRMWVRERFAG